MVTNVDLSEEEVAELQKVTQQASPADAVRVAMQDYLRYARRMQLKRLSGKVEMADPNSTSDGLNDGSV